MKNKLEFKKFMMVILGVGLIIGIVFLILNILEYKAYTKNFNEVINRIVNKVVVKYPKITEQEIVDILNNEEISSENTLDKYGMNLGKAIILENDKLYHTYLSLEILLLSLGSILLVILLIIYLKKRDKGINDITKYLEELNKKNYSLKIDSNSEDELSILKNEIYKVTVMLKETRDISIKDKLNLKKALEDISHQLKTPLTSILVMLDNLIEEEDMDKQTREDFIRDIKRNVINVNFLVQAILKLSKFEANTIVLEREKRLVRDILNEASKNVSTLCDLKNIKINIKGNKSDEVYCDFRWQVEAITNIIKNCSEHSYANSKLDITYSQNKAYTIIEIKDYGEGIDKKDLPHIFERFYKGNNSSKDSIGIGLALAKTIIESDNGVVGVKSDNEGTKFTIKYFNY